MGQYQKWFSNFDTGAPALDNTANSINAVLYACLVTGYNTKSISQIVVASGVATATCTGHGYPVVNLLYQDLDVTVEGSATTLLNGSKQITPTDANTFTFAAPGVSDGTYTGAVTCKKTPLGWARPFTGANKAVYARTDPAATPHVLVVEDTMANVYNCRVYAAESASAIDTYVDIVPTAAQFSGGYYWTRGANTSRAKNWFIIGDSKAFYIVVEASSWSDADTTGRIHKVPQFFGDINTFKAGDNYHCMLTGTSTASGTTTTGTPPLISGSQRWDNTISASHPSRMVRAQDGITKSPAAICIWPTGAGLDAPTVWYPSVVDNGLLWLRDVYVREEPSTLGYPVRGRLPGLVQPLLRGADFPAGAAMTPFEMTDGSGLRMLAGLGTQSTSGNSPFGFIANANWRA